MVDLINVKETLWGNLGAPITDKTVNTSEAFANMVKLNFEIDFAKMYDEVHNQVFNYHCIFRKDDLDIIGVVNKFKPQLIQNMNAFTMIEPLLQSGIITPETGGEFNHYQQMFGCFKVQEKFKLMDDDIHQYLLVLNEPLKADGKVTIVFSPVRVVCMNTLSAALNQGFYRARFPVMEDEYQKNEISRQIFQKAKDAVDHLEAQCNKLYKIKLSSEQMETVLDDLYPYVKVDGESLLTKQNENTEIIRNTFESECLNAPNLANFDGTALAAFHAITDFTQHYFKSVDKAYDLNYRMNLLPGYGTGTETDKVKKLLTRVKAMAA